MPLVVEAIEKKTCEFLQGNQQPGAVSCIADVQTLIGENREVCIRVQNWHAVEEKHCRILHARANVDYLLTLDTSLVTATFPVLKEGILRDVALPRSSWKKSKSTAWFISKMTI